MEKRVLMGVVSFATLVAFAMAAQDKHREGPGRAVVL